MRGFSYSKRKYTYIKIIAPKLVNLREVGKTNYEITECFGFKIRQIQNWIKPYHWKQSRISEKLPPKQQRRSRKHPPSTIVQEHPYEIEYLKTENRLFLVFLQLTERM